MPAWELADRSAWWMNHYLAAEAAEIQAENALRRRAERKQARSRRRP